MRTWLFVLLLLSVVACNRRRGGGGGDDDDDLGADGDADGDVDGDSDGDVDGDADVDGDSDGDVDGDADGDVDGDADGDVDGDVDGDADGDLDPCGWGPIPLDYEGPVEGGYSMAGGEPTPVTGTITLSLTPRAARYDIVATFEAGVAGGFTFLGDGDGTVECTGETAGTVSGMGGGIPMEGTFEGVFDDPDVEFQEGVWDIADTLGFGVVGSGTWRATEAL